MRMQRVGLIGAVLALLGAGSGLAQQADVPKPLPNIRDGSILALDQAHAAAQARAVAPWRFGQGGQYEVIQSAAARDLERIINEYEYARGLGKTDWRIGILLSDLGMAYGTQATERQKVRVLGAAVATLTPFVGQNAQLDLIYAQAVDRLASHFDRDRADRAEVARRLMPALRLLRERRSDVAERALLQAWSGGMSRTAELPGFEQVVVFAANRPNHASECPELASRVALVDREEKAGRPEQARRMASALAREIVAAGRRGCDIGYSGSVEQILSKGERNTLLADIAEARLRSEAIRYPQGWSRAFETGVPSLLAAIAEHGTLDQLRVAMPIGLQVAPKPGTTTAHPAMLARSVARWLQQQGDYRSAEVMFEKVRELRPGPSSESGGWGAADDVIAAALFHEEHGRRSRATELARIALSGFPARSLKAEDLVRARLMLARNARDEGDVLRATELVLQAARDAAAAGDVPLLRTVLTHARELPAATDPIFRAEMIAHAGAMLTRHGRDKSTEKVIIHDHQPSMELAFDVAVHYGEKPLFERAKAVSARSFEWMANQRYHKLSVVGNPAAAWFSDFERVGPRGPTGARESLSNSYQALILKKDYASINARMLTEKPGQDDCDFGRMEVIRLVARERAANRSAPAPAIDKAVNDNLCAGNSASSQEAQLIDFMDEGLFWLSAGEPLVAVRYLSKAVPQLVWGYEGRADANTLASRDPEAPVRLASLARARLEAGDVAGAAGAAEQATALIGQRLGTAGAGADRQREAARFRAPLDVQVAVAAAAAAGAGSPAELDAAVGRALAAMQLARATATADATARLGARLAAGEPALAALLRKRQDLADLIEREGQLIERAADDAVKLAASRRLAEARRQLDEAGAELRQRAPRLAEAETAEPATLSELRAALAPAEALLVSHSTGKDVHLALVTPQAARLVRVEGTRAALDDLVAELRLGLDIVDGRLDRFREDEAIALRRRLIAPFAAELAGKTHLTLVVDGALESLPFAVLAEPAASPGARPRYLVEQLSLANLPNVRSLVTLRAMTGATRGTQPFLGIGDPVLGPADGVARGAMASLTTRSAGDRVQELRRMASLPDTATELRTLSRLLKGDPDALWLGRQASEARVRTTPLLQYRTLTFASHALVAGEFDGVSEPGIVLTPPERPDAADDGLLTASEIATLNLHADLVILSACNTASPDGRPGADGLSGLARAFIAAGARALVVSHWRVESGATAALIGRFGGGLAEGRRPAEALRAAMLAALAGDKASAHPALWAAFFVVGAGG